MEDSSASRVPNAIYDALTESLYEVNLEFRRAHRIELRSEVSNSLVKKFSELWLSNSQNPALQFRFVSSIDGQKLDEDLDTDIRVTAEDWNKSPMYEYGINIHNCTITRIS